MQFPAHKVRHARLGNSHAPRGPRLSEALAFDLSDQASHHGSANLEVDGFIGTEANIFEDVVCMTHSFHFELPRRSISR